MSAIGDELARAVAELDEPRFLELVDRMLAEPEERKGVFLYIGRGSDEVTRRYRAGQYFIADIMMAGALYSEAVARAVRTGGGQPERGRVVLGVVSRDIHELGKNVIAGLLEYNGYDVVDLGADVSPAEFTEAVRTLEPDTLILSGVLDLSLVQMERTISAIEQAGLRDRVRVLLGGSCVTREQSEEIGADGYIDNLLDCLRLCGKGGV